MPAVAIHKKIKLHFIKSKKAVKNHFQKNGKSWLSVLFYSFIILSFIFVAFQLTHSRELTIVIKNTKTVVASKAVAGLQLKLVTFVNASDITAQRHFIRIPRDAKEIKVKKVTPEEIKQIRAEKQTIISAEETQELIKSIKDKSAQAQPRNNFIGGLAYGAELFLADVSESIGDIISSVIPDVNTQLVDVANPTPAATSEETSLAPESQETVAESVTESVAVEEPEEIVTPEVEQDLVEEETVEDVVSTSTEAEPVDVEEPEEIVTPETAQDSVEEETVVDAVSTSTESSEPVVQEDCIGNETDNCIAVEYELPAPVIDKVDTDNGQLVTVSAEDEVVPLVDVLAFTTIPEIYKVGDESKIKIKWKSDNGQEVQFIAKDLNGNGKIDYLEWVVPHLSEQTFEIIFISKAFHLDADKNIVADIYDLVAVSDGNFSTVPQDNFVRVTFQTILNETNDITISAKPTDSNKPVTIEVYPIYTDQNGNITEGHLIATFENINKEGTYKVLLGELLQPTDLFDLKILNGDVDIDYIVDPIGWLAGWSYRKEITVSNTNVASNLSYFPMLVKLTSDADIGTKASDTTNGYDIRFTDANGTTLLAYERESFSVSSGEATAIFWVQVPAIYTSPVGNQNTIYIYYGNAGASTDWTATSALLNGNTATYAQHVWDDGGSKYFKGVWHLDSLNDSTLSGNTLTAINSPTAGQVGKIGNSYLFDDALSQYLSKNTGLGITGYPVTISAWGKSDSVALKQGISGLTVDGNNLLATLVAAGDVAGDPSRAAVYMSPTVGVALSTAGFTANTWHYFTGVFSATNSRTAYINGGNAGSDSITAAPSAPTKFQIASYNEATFFSGYLDEVRISSVVRSADWIKFVYYNMSSASNELTFASEEGGVANFTWTNGTADGLWSTAGNWQGGVVPGTGDVATFNSASTADCSIDADISVAGITIDSTYSGTITQTGSYTITLSSAGFIQEGGTFVGGSADITNSGDFTLSDGSFTATSGNINIAGSMTFSSTGTFTHNNGTVIFNSTVTGKTVAGNAQSFNNLVFNGSGGGWTINDSFTVANDFTVTLGTVNTGATGNTITITNNLNANGGTLTGGANLIVEGGNITGDGTINITDGKTTLKGTGNFGSATNWTFFDLTFGDGSATETTTKAGANSITCNHEFKVATNHSLSTGSSTWNISWAQGTNTLQNIKQVSGTGYHALALDITGTKVYAWGSNNYGQLGDGTLVSREKPVRVLGVGGTGYLGEGADGPILQVSAGTGASYALKSDGSRIYAWGGNGSGELGQNNTNTATPYPVIVKGLGGTGYLGDGTNGGPISQISAGNLFVLALKDGGSLVYAWGYNNYGTLGQGNTTYSSVPLRVKGLGGTGYLGDGTNGGPILQVAAGTYNSYALKTDGSRVYAWGYNGGGGCGDNSTTQRTVPVQVYGLGITDGSHFLGEGGDYGGPISKIAGGAYNTGLALKDDGTRVYAWGYNNYGQLGQGGAGTSLIPLQVKGIGGTGYLGDTTNGGPISEIAGGYYSSYALKSDGTRVYAWGMGTSGQLGQSNTSNSTTPLAVKGVGGTGYIGDEGNGGAITGISASYYTFYSFRTSGSTVYAGGSNSLYSVGDGTTTNRTTPVQVLAESASITKTYVGLKDVSQIVSGSAHTLALKSDGTRVYAWGVNGSGQLGDNSTNSKNSPLMVLGVGGTGYLGDSNNGPIAQIAAGWTSSYALKTDGSRIYAWGAGNYGQLGQNNTSSYLVPVMVKGLGGTGYMGDGTNGGPISEIGGGFYHILALKTGGSRVYAWGYNGDGQVGDNSTTQRTVPIQVYGIGITDGSHFLGEGGDYGGPILHIAKGGGGYHSLAVKDDGTRVYAWGNNSNGQLGQNTNAPDSYIPLMVKGLSGTGYLGDTTNGGPISQVAYFGYHTSAALKSDGTRVYAWGYANNGQLGQSNNTDSYVPVMVKGVGGTGYLGDTTNGGPISQITGNNYNGMALKLDGTEVYSWAYNANGQLGDGTTTTRNSVVKVKGIGGTGYLGDGTNGGPISAIAVGASFGAAIKSDGSVVYSWGTNQNGELGNSGTTASSYTPIKVYSPGVKQLIVDGSIDYGTSNFQFTGNYSSNLGVVAYTSVSPATFYDLAFNNSSANFALAGNITTTRNLTITAGNFDASADSYSITVAGNWANSGTFVPSLGTVTFNAGTGTQTLNNSTSYFYNLTHSGAGTLQLATNNLAVTGAFINSAGTFDANALTNIVTGLADIQGGTYSASTNTQTFNGGLQISGGTFTGSSGAVDVNGNLVLSSGTLTAPSGAFTISGDWTKSGGTFTPGTYTTTFDGTAQTIQSATTFYTLVASSSTQLDINNITVNVYDVTVSVGGTLRLDQASDFLITSNTGVTTTPFINLGTVNMSNGKISTNSVNQAFARTAFINGSATNHTATFTQSGGLVTAVPGGGDNGAAMTNNAIMDLSGGTFNNFGYVSFNASSVTTISGIASFACTYFKPNGGTVNMTGGTVTAYVPNYGGTINHSGGTIYANYYIDAAGGSYYGTGTALFILQRNYFNITKAGSYWNDVQITANTSINASTNKTLDIRGDFTIDATKTFTTNNKNISLTGNWINNGTFTPGTGTVTLNGANQKVFGNSSFYNLTKDVSAGSADTLYFQQSKTQTINANGTLTLKGALGKILTLRGMDANGNLTDGDPKWGLTVSETGTTIAVDYVDVKDSDASGGTMITQTNSTDSNNNLNWIFNELPTASNISIDSGAASVILIGGITKNVVCTAVVTDTNGYADITSVTAKLYRSGVGAGAGDDNSDHYTLTGDSECVPSGGSGNTENYTCTFPVYFYADPTDAGATYEAENWVCQVTPSDNIGAGIADTDTIEMATLQSIDVDPTIEFTNMNPGAKSTGDHTITIANNGNTSTQFEVAGASLTCTRGTVPVGNQKYGLASFSYDTGGTALTESYALVPDSTLNKPTESVPTVTMPVYWQIYVPNGTSGTCSGNEAFNIY